MTKNTTRKGLALGSSFALVASAVVGFAAPAQASVLTVIPSTGSSTTFISGEAFSVKVLGQFAASDDLQWEIAGIDTANETVTATVSGGQAVAGTTTQTVNPTTVATTSGGNALAVAVAAGQTASVTVRAYVESGDAAGFSATYDTSFSAPLTVNFVAVADLTAVTTIASPLQGDTTVSASMYFVGINNEQITAGDVGVYFTKGDGTTLYPAAAVTASSQTGTVVTYTAANNYVVGQTVTVAGLTTNAALNLTGAIVTASATDFTIAATTATVASVTEAGTASVSAAASVKSGTSWSATDSFKYTTSAVSALIAATGIKVQPLYKAAGSPASTDVVATAATATVGTRVAATVTGASVVSVTANSSNQSLLNSSFSVKATIKDGSTVPAAVAGAAVTATVATSATLSATVGSVISLAVAGSTYTANSALPGTGTVAKLALTTDANGEVVVPLSTVGFAADQTVTVTFTTENLTGSVVSTQKAATYTATKAAFVTTTDGASVGVSVAVYDQFGGRPANDYDVRAVWASSTQATAAATTATSTNVALVGGAATLVLTDDGTGVGVNTYNVTIEKRAAGGAFGAALTGISSTTLAVHVKTAGSLVAATVTSNGTQDATTKVYAIVGPVALSLVGTAAYDSTTVLGTAPSTFTGALNVQNITGTVSTVASATAVATAVPGASVTISGAGLQFGNGSGEYAIDSVTVVANTSGIYSANVYSNKAGKQTLTITSGSASATTTVTFAAAADNTGAVLTIAAPDYVAAGSTFSATALLVDKFGNVVDSDQTAQGTAQTFLFSAVSPGFQVGTNPTATGADGVAKLAYFLGNNDSASIVLTAVYDIDGVASTTADRFTVTKTVIIGVAPVAVVVPDTKVNVGSFKGYVALYAKGYAGKKMSAIVAGKWIVVASLATDFERVVRYTGAGYDIVTTIYIDGVSVQSFNVTTK